MADTSPYLSSNLFTAIYQSDGVPYSITIRGSYQEIYMHCLRLNLKYDGTLMYEEAAKT
jgi:hypothetical protein